MSGDAQPVDARPPMGTVERRVTSAMLGVTVVLMSTVLGTYIYGANTSPRHVSEGSAALEAPADQVLALLHDMDRRPEWRPEVTRIARKADPEDPREVWREMDREDDRFDFEVVERSSDGLVLRTEAAEQIGYEATWTFRVEPAANGTRVHVREEGHIDNPLFRGVFWLRGDTLQTVTDELTWLGLAVDGHAPTLEDVTVTER